MTMQAMSEMLEKATTDEIFTKGLVEAVGEKQGDQAIAAVTEYGTANGFAITAEDVAEMQRELLTADDGSDGDLDDADLENVSGGNYLRRLADTRDEEPSLIDYATGRVPNYRGRNGRPNLLKQW
ncbi:hypothetical protein [Nisaea nitritireducens]|uniref:hypothetical protein n=1 Tax=Nisaea nitritireducens TaxID=568392 RepID=UPI0018689401|nr:hypothetical protein [Nisaea nitritireducens]